MSAAAQWLVNHYGWDGENKKVERALRGHHPSNQETLAPDYDALSGIKCTYQTGLTILDAPKFPRTKEQMVAIEALSSDSAFRIRTEQDGHARLVLPTECAGRARELLEEPLSERSRAHAPPGPTVKDGMSALVVTFPEAQPEPLRATNVFLNSLVQDGLEVTGLHITERSLTLILPQAESSRANEWALKVRNLARRATRGD